MDSALCLTLSHTMQMEQSLTDTDPHSHRYRMESTLTRRRARASGLTFSLSLSCVHLITVNVIHTKWRARSLPVYETWRGGYTHSHTFLSFTFRMDIKHVYSLAQRAEVATLTCLHYEWKVHIPTLSLSHTHTQKGGDAYAYFLSHTVGGSPSHFAHLNSLRPHS